MRLWGIALLGAALLMGGRADAQLQSLQFYSTQTPSANGNTATAVTCGTTSTAFGVTGNTYLSVQIPAGGQTTCFAWGSGATATMAPPSQCYAAGSFVTWGGGTGACIVAATTQAISVMTR